MSLATERCGRCGNAMVSMETDMDVIRAARCPRCLESEERRRGRMMTATLACTAVLVVASAWQMLIA